MTKTTYTISEANRITGKSRTTITKHLDDGTLSFVLDTDNNRVIEASELMRVYGDDLDFDRAAPPGKSRSSGKKSTVSKVDQSVQSELNSVQQQLDREMSERQRERAQFEQQVDHLQNALQLAQEGLNKTTNLLEDRTERAGDWETSFQAMEKRLANFETRADQKIEKLQQTAIKYKRAYEQEKEKPLWKRLFG